MDKIIVTGDDREEMKNLRVSWQKNSNQGLGNLRYFLGIEVTISKRGIYVTQRKYILNFLNEPRC